MLPLIVPCFICQSGHAQDSIFGRTDTQKEIEIGRAAYDHMLSQGLLSRNDAYIRRVQRVLTQLLSAMPTRLYSFQAVVVADNEMNAGCYPGGYIVVNEGLLVMMPDDNQLAFTLAHEIGHGYRRHLMREIRKTQSEVATQIFVAAIFGTTPNNNAVGLARLRFSREHETEADAFGTELYLRAGFDPSAVADGMRTIAASAAGHERPPEYLNSHPEPARRVASIEKLRDRLLESGLKPISAEMPTLDAKSVFGELPTLAARPCDWMPTTPGTEWQYEVQGGTGGNTQYRVNAIGLAQIGLTPVARMEIELGGQVVPYQLIVDGDRIWRRNRPSDIRSLWTLEVQFPEMGTIDGTRERIFEPLGTESVNTPAGDYIGCLKLRQKEGSKSSLLWFAKNVGLVKRINEQTGTVELLVKFRAGQLPVH